MVEPEPVNVQTLIIRNDNPTPLEIMVEITPERYVLQPKDMMEITADLRGEPFQINAYPNGLQIFAGRSMKELVKINGVEAISWSDP